eukprot:1550948-Prymnesium_polylepis.1
MSAWQWIPAQVGSNKGDGGPRGGRGHVSAGRAPRARRPVRCRGTAGTMSGGTRRGRRTMWGD